MKTFVSAAMVLGVLSLGMTGCADKSSVKSETKVTTPGGTTTTTKEVEVKKSGDNPPPAAP